MLPIRPVKKLLYATDLSEGAIYALRYAVRLAESVDGEVYLLHALEPLSSEARITLQSLTDKRLLEQATKRRRQTAREMMAERQRDFWDEAGSEPDNLRARVAGIEVIEGNPADIILTHAKKINADLILMGSHEHGIAHTYLGRIAQRVLRRSHIPTLIIPYPDN